LITFDPNHPALSPNKWDSDFFSVYADGIKVGFLRVWRRSPNQVGITEFQLHPKYRRLGYGRAAIELLDKRFRDMGATEVVLNKASSEDVPFWQRVGFEKVADSGGGYQRMRKTL